MGPQADVLGAPLMSVSAHGPSNRKHGGAARGPGGAGVVRCPEIGAELFAWFVDSIRNIVGRIPSFLLLHVAHGLARALSQGHEQDKEAGLIPPHAVLDLPKLDHNWLRRWRRMHHVTWRTVTLRFKCSRDTIRTRLLVFWKTCFEFAFCMISWSRTVSLSSRAWTRSHCGLRRRAKSAPWLRRGRGRWL